MKAAREQLMHETDIIAVIRNQRLFRKAIDRLLIPTVVKNLEHESEFKEVIVCDDNKMTKSKAPKISRVLPEVYNPSHFESTTG